MLTRMRLVWGVVASVFKKPIAPFFTFLAVILLKGLVSLGLALDHLFFPKLAKTKIEKPIVIVGNPRSGTTFMQRFLTNNGFGTGMRLWKMIYPSLTLQFFLKPFLPLLEKFSPAKHHSASVHETNLLGIETDDPSLLFRFFDGFFLYGFFLSWAEKDYKEMFDPQVRDTSKRDFDYWEKMWRRNLVSEKQTRIVPKVFSLGVRLPKFLERFPDAKVLYLVRDPLATVPSGLSLVTGVLDARFGFWSLPEEKRNHFLTRLYDAFLDLSLKFHADYVAGKLSEENVKIVPFNRMMQDFDNLMAEVMDFIGEEPSAELQAKINETAEKQRAFKSSHKYDLAKFGLTEEKIKEDYKAIYETFF